MASSGKFHCFEKSCMYREIITFVSNGLQNVQVDVLYL